MNILPYVPVQCRGCGNRSRHHNPHHDRDNLKCSKIMVLVIPPRPPYPAGYDYLPLKDVDENTRCIYRKKSLSKLFEHYVYEFLIKREIKKFPEKFL